MGQQQHGVLLYHKNILGQEINNNSDIHLMAKHGGNDQAMFSKVETNIISLVGVCHPPHLPLECHSGADYAHHTGECE